MTQLPGWLWARMGRVSKALVVLAALGVITAAALLAPQIAGTKRDNEAQERREAAEARARAIRELKELQRPRTGRSAQQSRALVVLDLERLITTDARSRPQVGRVLRTECEAIPADAARTRFSCTAVSSDIPKGERSRGGAIGYPFRALVDFRTGRLAWCRIAGRPGEGSNKGRGLVEIPARCGG